MPVTLWITKLCSRATWWGVNIIWLAWIWNILFRVIDTKKALAERKVTPSTQFLTYRLHIHCHFHKNLQTNKTLFYTNVWPEIRRAGPTLCLAKDLLQHNQSLIFSNLQKSLFKHIFKKTWCLPQKNRKKESFLLEKKKASVVWLF